jgi:hypothetical protein
MPNRIPLDEVTKRVFERLESESAGWAYPASIYTTAPQNASMPYVELGNFTDVNEGTKDRLYGENTQSINAYSSQPGTLELHKIMNQIVEALGGAALEGQIDNNFRIVLSRNEFAEAMQAVDPQGIPFRFGTIRFRFKVEDELT